MTWDRVRGAASALRMRAFLIQDARGDGGLHQTGSRAQQWSVHPGFMRVLIVDQDSTMLEAIARALADYFSIDIVTSKADCLDLLRTNPFDVVISCERLEDGSGLELLSQISKR